MCVWQKKEEEPAPGVEGLVYDEHRSFNFDCHYEQGLMRFKKDELAIFNPDGTLKDDAMISFAIRTPFCDKIISYHRTVCVSEKYCISSFPLSARVLGWI